MEKNQVKPFWLFCISLLIGLGLIAGTVFAANPPFVKINKGKSLTKTRKVTLYFSGVEDVREMKVSNQADFAGAGWESFKKTKTWYLSYGKGTKTVYTKFKDKKKKISQIYNDNITLSVPENMTVDFEIEDGEDSTKSRYAVLQVEWSQGVEVMRISNSGDFSGSDWVTMKEEVGWILSPDSGNKKVQVQFRDANGNIEKVVREIKYNQPQHYVPEGSLLKGQSSTVYYLGYDGRIHPFFNSALYHSWYSNFDSVKYVSNSKLSQYPIGQPVCVRPGTWLVKFRGWPRVYAVEPGCVIRPIRSEAEAHLLYGNDWARHVLELDPILEHYYEVNNPEVGEDEEDNDFDGVDSEIEEEYGTNDKKTDSDEDGLDDYEEIFFWFSDPLDSDTDDDGYKDGLEVISGFSPVGVGKSDSVPNGTYEYPLGSLVKSKKDDQVHYRKYNGEFDKVEDKAFISNKFQSRFIIEGAASVPFSSGKRKLKDSLSNIRRPQLRNSNNSLISL